MPWVRPTPSARSVTCWSNCGSAFRSVSRRSPRRSISCASSRESIAQHGRFNYLLSNGEYLIAHCADKLCYILRHAPFAQAHLIDQDVTVDFSALTTPEDKVAVIATTPLTDNEHWTEMAAGQLIAFEHGAPVLTR